MRALLIMLLSMLLMGACHSGKSITERAIEKQGQQMADSIKYAKVREAFVTRQFVFKLNRKRNAIAPPSSNYIKLDDTTIWYQDEVMRRMPPIQMKSGKITSLTQTSDTIKKTITLSGCDTRIFSYFSITLYEGSNKAFGYLWQPSYLVEGWIEPLDEADVVQGFKSILYD